MQRLANEDAEAVVKALGQDLLARIKEQGRAAVKEAMLVGNKQGLALAEMPYLFWALANRQGLPNLGSRERAFQVMLDIMTRTGVMPNYQKNFKVTDDLSVDAAVDAVAVYLAKWADKAMVSALLVSYVQSLTKFAPRVSAVTDGAVPSSNGEAYLNTAFRQLLTLKSAWFSDGELLRRVVRLLPEW